MTFVSTDPQNHQSENTWFTPVEFKHKLGMFDLDPCTVSYRPFDMAKHNFEYDKEQCGLELAWSGDVWLNPPYGKEIEPFIEKFIMHKKGVMLIFARMGNKNVQKLVRSGAFLFMLRKRIHFIDKNLKKHTNAGADSCLVFYQDKWYEIIANNFDGVFMKDSSFMYSRPKEEK